MTDEHLMILYQEMILDHGREPRHFGKLEKYNFTLEGFNPLCGDKLTLYLKIKKNRIEQASFEGEGCAISMASSSMMLEAIQGKTLQEASELFEQFHAMVLSQPFLASQLGKLALLEGVKTYPSRIKCATLAWHTLESCLKKAADSEQQNQ